MIVGDVLIVCKIIFLNVQRYRFQDNILEETVKKEIIVALNVLDSRFFVAVVASAGNKYNYKSGHFKCDKVLFAGNYS